MRKFLFAIISLSFLFTLSFISCDSNSNQETETNEDDTYWLNATSLKDTYSSYFDKFGIAVEYDNSYGDELISTIIQQGLVHHANSITMGNEFKPDFIFNWATPNTSGSFTGSNGTTISVPTNTPNWTRPDAILKICKDTGLTMRGHVLVWHSQTPSWFFYKDFDTTSTLVDTATMNARLEWYIKTVLTHISDWEKTNNNGEHIIYTWDVVNEAMINNGKYSDTKWLRGSDNDNSSMWYNVYGNSDEYIVNAFRYANKYAPSDVLLAYNDYNCFWDGKTDCILKLIDDVQSHEDNNSDGFDDSDGTSVPSRIDVIGMQSHISTTWPTVDSYEEAVKKFLAKGLDVQVTELDISTPEEYVADELKSVYKSYFKMFINNKKTSSSTNGISGVTFWGITDGNSWLNSTSMTAGYTRYPLLFDENYYCKPAFYGVIEAVQ